MRGVQANPNNSKGGERERGAVKSKQRGKPQAREKREVRTVYRPVVNARACAAEARERKCMREERAGANMV